jgi:hypothetical protein
MWVCSFFEWQAAGFCQCYALAAELSRRPEVEAMSARTSHAADSKRSQGIAAVALCSILWSTSGLFIKLVPWNPFAIAGIRSLFGGLVLLTWLRRPHFTWSRVQIAAAVFYAATMISFVVANKLTTSANAILLQYGAPVYAAFLAVPMLGERTHWYGGRCEWRVVRLHHGASEKAEAGLAAREPHAEPVPHLRRVDPVPVLGDAGPVRMARPHRPRGVPDGPGVDPARLRGASRDDGAGVPDLDDRADLQPSVGVLAVGETPGVGALAVSPGGTDNR